MKTDNYSFGNILFWLCIAAVVVLMILALNSRI